MDKKKIKKLFVVVGFVVLIFGGFFAVSEYRKGVRRDVFVEKYLKYEFYDWEDVCVEVEDEVEREYCYYFRNRFLARGEVFSEEVEELLLEGDVSKCDLMGENEKYCRDYFYMSKLGEGNRTREYCSNVVLPNNKKQCLNYFEE